MKIGGLQKSSLINYPGNISCVLFLAGCNFDCPYCHNPGLKRATDINCPGVDTDDFLFDFLKSRLDFLDGVVISGGEPTLQEDLPDLCENIKSLGYQVKLDTNGSRPDELEFLIKRDLVDYVAMDIKTDPYNYDPLINKGFNPEDLLSSIRIIMESARDYELRTTCVKGFVDKRIVEGIARLIEGAKLYALQQFQHSEVLHPEIIKGPKAGYGPEEMDFFRQVADPWVRECIVRY